MTQYECELLAQFASTWRNSEVMDHLGTSERAMLRVDLCEFMAAHALSFDRFAYWRMIEQLDHADVPTVEAKTATS